MENIKVWRLKAKCKNAIDPDKFFPERGNASNKEFCTGCPVVDQCRTYAIAHDEDGIWGGTSYTERKNLPPLIKKLIREQYYEEGLLEYRSGLVQLFLEQKAEELREHIVPISLKVHVMGRNQVPLVEVLPEYIQQNNA